jgi:hypothetical protein
MGVKLRGDGAWHLENLGDMPRAFIFAVLIGLGEGLLRAFSRK